MKYFAAAGPGRAESLQLWHFVQNFRKPMKGDATPTRAVAGIIVIPDVAYIAFKKNGACCLDRNSQRVDREKSDDTGFGSLMCACVI